MSNEEERKSNEQYSKNFTRIPNILFIAYPDLSKLEKYLYGDLRRIYWDMKPRFVSLRELSDLTDFSIGALSKMIPHLHEAGLIHAEVRRAKGRDGKAKGNPKYHITIVDIWEINRMFFSCPASEQGRLAAISSAQLVEALEKTCSRNEQDLRRNPQPVHEMNKPVHTMNDPVHEMNKLVSSGEQVYARTEHAKDSNKDLSKDREKESDHSNISTFPTTHTRTTTSHLSGDENHVTSVNKKVEAPPLLTPEQHAWFENVYCKGKWIAIAPKMTQKLAEQVVKISHVIKTVEEWDGYYEYVKARIADLPDAEVKPGNLAEERHLNGWRQTQLQPPSQPQQKSPSSVYACSSGQYGMIDFSKDPRYNTALRGKVAK